MNRREFVTKSCLACISGGLLSSVLSSCQSTHYVSGTFDAKGILIPKEEFIYLKKDEQMIRQFIVVHNEKLEFPIYLFRESDNEYNALWMKCSHQGSELRASGDHLHCPSHGSEFDRKGKVVQGPAENPLRSFPTSVNDESIFIELTSA